MNLKSEMVKSELRPYLLQARFGLEKESQRVNTSGELAATDHPAQLGNRSFHPYIQTDFSETQMELITPVADSIPDVLRYLAAIHDVALRSLSPEERLWPLSMPPALPEDEQDIQIAKLDCFEDVLYRRHLASAYGKRKQMVSGIHVNFEFGADFIQVLYRSQTEYSSIETFKSALYMKLTRNFLHYRWLYTYLYGAAPLSEAHYFLGQSAPVEPVRSIRNSQYGYTNQADVQADYTSLSSYTESIAQLVHTGKLSEEKEFYAPIRLRGGKQVADLATAGVRYVELRNVDLNPYSPLGITSEQLAFIHYFMLYLLWTDEEGTTDWIADGQRANNQVALENPLQPSAWQQAGQEILTEMMDMCRQLELEAGLDLCQALYQWFEAPEKTLAGRWYAESQQTSQEEQALSVAEDNYQLAQEKPYQLAGFRGMELSTQILLFDAIQKGIAVEVLDEADQFLKLSADQHVEYVKNANMTSQDTYIAPLIMANKTVTKKILAQKGFRVPLGAEFGDLASGLAAYNRFGNKPIVVKPKTTNYGLGISIFKEGTNYEDYQQALEIAFAEDSAVLIEEFFPGTEYRFFVLDGQVHAIMLRVPANVLGDGIHTIRELVADKNQDPLRGTDHRAPLEQIQLGEIEQLMLKEQGLTIDDIPPVGQQVFLRENSNVSTGGDSIDVTDEMDQSYKELAIAAVEALGAKISGIDLIIPDKNQPATKDSYGIIEANFNPAMHMHVYPYQGQGRRLTLAVLKLLFPERFQG